MQYLFFKQALDSFQQLFTQKLKHDDLGTPISFALDYETVLAYNKSPLSDKIYKKLDPQLSQEWEELKKRYDIK